MPNVSEFEFGASFGPKAFISNDDGSILKELRLTADGSTLEIAGEIIEHNLSRFEETHIEQISTTSSSFVELSSPKLTNPAAGTYLILFSCVARNSNSNGWANIILSADGTGEILHSERKMKGNQESSLSTSAVVSLNGSQSVTVKIKRTGNGSAEFTNKNLVAIRLGGTT